MILLWLAWAIFVIWCGRHIGRKWSKYRSKDIYALDPPELSTFLFIELVLVSNGILRILLDQKTLYPTLPGGFLGTGFSEAQDLFILAWAVLVGTFTRWYWIATKGNARARWNVGCWMTIIGLFMTSLFCWLILDIPLSRNAPYLTWRPS